jgi:hypothetical protein
VPMNGDTPLVTECSTHRLRASGKKQTPSGHPKAPVHEMSDAPWSDHGAIASSNQQRKSSAGSGGI